jgi:hypothetical protein
MMAAHLVHPGENDTALHVDEEPGQARSGSANQDVLPVWLRVQEISLARHAAALRPFRMGEFGETAASPSEAHRQAANQLIESLRKSLFKASRNLKQTGASAAEDSSFPNLARFTGSRDRGHGWVDATERVWSFYYDLFNQRQSAIGKLLLACDRIGIDCYQAVYTGLGEARSIPSPPPFSYMDVHLSPATFRRGISMAKLGRHANPFPLVKLPYHRLVNPWTLGAISHEVAHNLQSDLGLWERIRKKVYKRLIQDGFEPSVAKVWARWHKEIFADLCGLLLSGPAFVGSLMDVVGRSPLHTLLFDAQGVHPTPYLRVFLNLDLLRRMGFQDEAADYERAWNRLYPSKLASMIPAPMRNTFKDASRQVVKTICFTPYSELGGKSLAEVTMFRPKDQAMVEEAAGRLASGTDPGIIPERFLIGAARWAVDRKLARPGVIARNFYESLGRR